MRSRVRRAAVGDPGGDVQEPVAQPFRFGGGEFAVEEQQLGPGEQVTCGQREFEPGGVDREDSRDGNRPKPVSLPQRMRSSTRA